MKDKNSLPCGRPIPNAPPPHAAKKLDQRKFKLKSHLSSEKLKYTDQRWAIAKVILKSGGHLDAQEIVSIVKKSQPSIGAATVYRNIKVLCDAGLLELTHQTIDGRDVYELPDEDHHDHILCVDCGEVFEFNNSKIESLQVKVAKENSFKLTDHRHVIHASCDFLKKKRAR